MKIMIYASYGGTCGVRAFQQGPGSQFIEVSRSARLQQLNEINSCIDGLLDAGVDEILVWDDTPGNPDQNPLNVYALHGENTFLADNRDYAGPVARVDASFDGAILLGETAMNHTPNAFMAHTMDAQIYDSVKINGAPIGDLGLRVLCNSYFNVPTILVSGDDKACKEALDFCGSSLKTVVTKKGISRHKSMNYSVKEVCDSLREKAALAVKDLKNIPVKKLQAPYEAEIKVISQNYAGQLLQRGAEMISDSAGILRSDDLLDLIAQINLWAPGAHFKRFGLTPESNDFFSAISLD